MKHFNSIKISLTNVGDILGIVIFFIFTLASRTLYNGPYSPFNNWLSDLGNSSKNPSGYIYFDIGCILLGFAVIIQTVGLVRWKTINRNQDNLILISQYCGLLMAIAVIMVAIFSEDYGKIHYYSSSSIFCTTINLHDNYKYCTKDPYKIYKMDLVLCYSINLNKCYILYSHLFLD